MKKIRTLFVVCIMCLSIVAVNVYARNMDKVDDKEPVECCTIIGDNLCSDCENNDLFTICDKRNKNCITINTNTINNNQKYDLFEIKDKEIYLDNSEITLEFDNIWSLLDYKIHISGTNKIHYLNSINQGKIMEPALVEKYPDLYSKDYIPFSVVGDGTLDIDVANQIKKNSDGEIYYKYWMLDVIKCEFPGRNIIAAYEVTKSAKEAEAAGANYEIKMRSVDYNSNSTSSNIHLLKKTTSGELIEKTPLLTEAEINTSDNTVTFKIPKYGYTVTDIKNKFAENADAFYMADVDRTMTMQEFNEAPPALLKSYAGANDNVLTADGRRAFIDQLIQNGKNSGSLKCGDSYLTPSNPATEETQITAAWGEEYIKTDLRRSFSSDGHYLINFPEEKNMITTTKKDNIVFESTEEFDPNYHLVVDDITEKITDIQSASVQAKTDKTLVELYDIYMADENDNVVKMENGTYKIKVELNDLLRKYEGYEIIYIGDDNKVELIDASVEDNYIVFNTTHLSKYGVVGTEIKKTGNIITNPKTADSVVTYGLALGALAVAVALVVLRIRKLKRD